jgi:hypothetical protein
MIIECKIGDGRRKHWWEREVNFLSLVSILVYYDFAALPRLNDKAWANSWISLD